jgi:phospholipid/cholesterol/gamma-HCH transport system substrate-binding protein
MSGNNVRYNGINVGMVTNVFPISDTAIQVEFTIDLELTKFIKKNALVSIGTDGLLGNKLINISPQKIGSKNIEEGDIMQAVNPLKVDNALRTLLISNDNLKEISENLKGVTQKINENNSLWTLLSDETIALNIKSALVEFKQTGKNTAILTGDLSTIVKDVKSGKGSLGSLITDDNFSRKLDQTIIKINSISDSLAHISGNFQSISKKIKNGEGNIGTLITDTLFVHQLNESMENIKVGSVNFNQNMEALKHSWPFKKYFRKQNKSKIKTISNETKK